jgi:hypothetical protein
MTEKILYWVSVFFGFVALLLFVGNTVLINGNRQLQEEVGRRQGIINNASNLANLNQGLAQTLAEIALKQKDDQVRDLLAAQGITVRAPAATDDSDAAKSKKK